ncbi:MAG: energy-coupling factor ABC transporter permease [Planctomycetales bacterium]|jgi:cobalt/nickel transport system permease protein|nr:energy-coupling factor ABC transporter permease [Planctomycetales bacterium]
MHIRDGILGPEVCLAAAAASAGAIAYSLRRLRIDLEDRAVPLTGMMAALVFAGQMVNFPLLGLPVSGHLLGGVLASVLLGPWAGCLAIAMVLFVQAVLFHDGGLLSLGANILNMGVVGAWGGYAIYASLRRLFGSGMTSTVSAAVVAAWLSVLAAAALFCVEFGLSSTSIGFDPQGVFQLMVFYHGLVGVGEAIITGSVLAFVLSRRADLIPSPAPTSSIGAVGRFVVAGMVAALAVAALVAPFKSVYSDGLDAVSEQLGFMDLKTQGTPLLLGGYEIPLLSPSWYSVSLAGLLGTVIVFSGAMVLVGIARWQGNRLTMVDGSDG